MACELPDNDSRIEAILALDDPKVVANKITYRKRTITRLKRQYKDIKSLSPREVPLGRLQRLKDDMNVSFQLNNLLHDQHNLLHAVEEPPSHQKRK